MAGYGKIHSSLWKGSLRGDSHGQLVMMYACSNCDIDGVLDEHPRSIAEATGLVVDEVWIVCRRFEEPDPESRSTEHDGRRFVRLTQDRTWGWKIVNYEKYRELRSTEDRRDYHRKYWRDNRSPKREPIASPSADPTIAISFPTKLDGVLEHIDHASVAEWSKAYPSVDVPAKLDHLRQWLLANPAKLRLPRFTRVWIVNRLAEDQQKAPRVEKELTPEERVASEKTHREQRARELEESRERDAPPDDPEALERFNASLAALAAEKAMP